MYDKKNKTVIPPVPKIRKCYVCGDKSKTEREEKVWLCSFICLVQSCCQDNEGCWEQVRRLRYKNRTMSLWESRKVVFTTLNAEIEKGNCVVPSCGNNDCINPDHLIQVNRKTYKQDCSFISKYG